jgi:beta-galactosidase GanA
MGLKSWGMQFLKLEDVPIPRPSIDPPDQPIMDLAYTRFQKDNILDFFAEQVNILRSAGVIQTVLTDWTPNKLAPVDDPKTKGILDISGLNTYEPSEDADWYWEQTTCVQDLHRSVNGNNRFFETETRVGVTGGNQMWGSVHMPDQLKMWVLEAAAFGAIGVMHWSGNRWAAGHWPHWGGVLDWSGNPEPDYQVTAMNGAFFKQWGTIITANPVKATVAVITDFDQRSALNTFPHANNDAWYRILYQSFDAFHRLALGVDGLNMQSASNSNNLKKYSVVVLACDAVLDRKDVVDALRTFVSQGGKLIVTCFTAYQSWDGVMRTDGFASNLKEITGCYVQTLRQMAWSADQKEYSKTLWTKDFQSVITPIGAGFFCEMMVPGKGKTVATFEVRDPYVTGKPAAIVNTFGNGSSLKLGYCPEQEDYIKIIRQFCSIDNEKIQLPLPIEIKSVPRTDNSLFLINTSGKITDVQFKKQVKDRISGKTMNGKISLAPYEVCWIE